MDTTHSVLVFEPRQELRHWLCTLLMRTQGFRLVGACSTLEELESEADRLEPQIILLDIGGISGHPLPVSSRLKARLPGVFLVLMDLDEGPSYQRLALAEGGNGFLCKAHIPEYLADLRLRMASNTSAPQSEGRS